MAAASVLFALLERAGGAAVEVVVVVVDGAPLGVVARCFGAIFVCKSCRRHQMLGAGRARLEVTRGVVVRVV
jgi:hypothetical protein